MNTVTLNMYMCFVEYRAHQAEYIILFVWLRHRNT